MMAAFQQQQKQTQFQMNYMNQMNPMLMQQQMIYQMQYRQPYYNHQNNRQV